MNNLFHHDKQGELEGQIIGKVSVYNLRVEEIQKILKEAGFEPGPIDGVMGAQTRVAIRNFQKKEGLKSTGKIDSVTQLALNKEKEIEKPLFQPETEFDKWESSLTNKGAPAKIDKEDSTNRAKAQHEVLTSRLNPNERIKQIQTALKNAGFYKGEIDGKIGPRTNAAIRAFQRAKKLNSDGVVGPGASVELNKFLSP
ncbi:MAG: peptidoglycan-binding protein [Candidatus Omnitrophota bacterium]|nr:peptidoglycan-binding protein [Candidatus Omnitrophota bacterium]